MRSPGPFQFQDIRPDVSLSFLQGHFAKSPLRETELAVQDLPSLVLEGAGDYCLMMHKIGTGDLPMVAELLGAGSEISLVVCGLGHEGALDCCIFPVLGFAVHTKLPSPPATTGRPA